MLDIATPDLVAIDKVSSRDYLQQVFACYRARRIAVPIDRQAPLPTGLSFADRLRPRDDSGWFTEDLAPIHDDTPAQLSFSSGTTGAPKPILLSHRALADATERLIEAMAIDGSIAEYLGVPATYSFGLARARVVAAVGGRLYVPPRGFDPAELARMLAAGEVNALSAVPTLLRVLIANPGLIPPAAAGALRWLEIGSQPMSADEKRAVLALFPNARIVQHYGLTEASRTTFLDLRGADAEGLASVGSPIGATELRIDEAGHICIRGPHVATGLLHPDGLAPVTDGEGWLRTSDLGRIDAAGRLHFLGRADHVMNIGGIKVPAELLEERIAALLTPAAGAAIAVAGVPDAMRGEIAMVAHLADADRAALAAAVRQAAATFALKPADIMLAEVAAIPRTETGKIQRSALAHLAPPPAAPCPPAGDDAGMTEGEREIARIWSEALGGIAIGRDDTFFDLGGDSLSAINVMLRMERAGVPPEITQQIFAGLSVREIAAGRAGHGVDAAPPSRRAQTAEAIAITRGIMVYIVIAVHWLPFALVRMGSLAEPLGAWLTPFFRLGTPGFAIVFGMGLAYFNMPMLERHPRRLRTNLRRNALIVGSGVLILAAMEVTAALIEGAAFPSPTELFFGVLLSYLLLVLMSELVLRAVRRPPHQIVTAIILALASLLLSGLVRAEWGAQQTTGWTELARLVIVTKYGLPQMLGYAAAGMAMGLAILRGQDDPALPGGTMLAGVALLLASAVVTVTHGLEAQWFAGQAATVMIIAYCGIVIALFGAALALLQSRASAGMLRLPLRFFAISGTLAFIAYVGHELAMPAREILRVAGVPDVPAIILPVALFALLFGYAIRRLYRLHYGR